MNNLLSTRQKYSSDGDYTENRKVLHESIIEIFFVKEINTLDPPEAIILGGGSASGKSTIRDFFHKDYVKKYIPIVVVDSDAIKNYIPEYSSAMKTIPKYAAKIVHDESSDISKNLLSICILEEKNLIYDGTMKNKEKYSRIISELKKKGYKVTIVVVDVPLEIAKERNEIRFLKTQRLVPLDELEKSHREVPSTFIQLKDSVDEYLVIDMRGDKDPFEYIATKVDGIEKVQNEEKYKEFLNKRFK